MGSRSLVAFSPRPCADNFFSYRSDLMKFWASILFFLAEGALFAYGMVAAVGSEKRTPTFIPLIVAFVVIIGMFSKLGCLDNAPKDHH